MEPPKEVSLFRNLSLQLGFFLYLVDEGENLKLQEYPLYRTRRPNIILYPCLYRELLVNISLFEYDLQLNNIYICLAQSPFQSHLIPTPHFLTTLDNKNYISFYVWPNLSHPPWIQFFLILWEFGSHPK